MLIYYTSLFLIVYNHSNSLFRHGYFCFILYPIFNTKMVTKIFKIKIADTVLKDGLICFKPASIIKLFD